MAAPGKISLALGAKRPPPAPTKTKRPHSALQDSDDEDAAAGTAEDISHFDIAAGGAIDASKPAPKGPLVIQKQANRDWREESQRKKQRSGLPAEAQALRAQQASGPTGAQSENLDSGQAKFGLTVVEKRVETEEGAEAGEKEAKEAEQAAVPAVPKTDDQLALEALLGEKPKSTLVLPVASEEEAFHRDYETAPDMATLEEYDAVPVEEFGAALLRGMGWKEGEALGKRKGQKAVQPRILERRPALLGIGAKEDAAIGVELGTWGKDAKGSKGPKGPRRKVEQAYNPVLLKNTKTGETMTEEELKAKVEGQKNGEKELQTSSRRESPSRDSDRKALTQSSSSRRKYDDEYDSDRRDKERRREKERERERERDRDRDRDYDRKYKSSRRDRSASVDDRDRRRRRERDERDRRDDRRYRDDDRYEKSSSRRERDRDGHRDSDRHRRR